MIESLCLFICKHLFYQFFNILNTSNYISLFSALGVYNIEPLSDMSWSVLSYGLNAGYHFWILQSVALVCIPDFLLILREFTLQQFFSNFVLQPVQVNLSHMLCAAILDPFEGQNYRIWAIIHQAFLCPSLCKLFCYGSNFFLTKFPPTRVKQTLEATIPKENCTYEQNEKLHEDSNTSGNGHTHFD